MKNRFQLEIDLLRLERLRSENKAALRQAKCDLREAKVAQVEYSGSFRSFKDKLTGRREQAETELRHAVQNAEAALTSAQHQKEALDARLTETKQALDAAPAWESLNDGSAEWYRLEARYCTEVLGPLLTATRELLVERRNQFNGSYDGEVKSRQELAHIYSAPEAAGEACRPYLLRLKAALDKLDIPLELHSYFDAPTAFLSSATKYTRMDRINEAIRQTESMLRLLAKLPRELE